MAGSARLHEGNVRLRLAHQPDNGAQRAAQRNRHSGAARDQRLRGEHRNRRYRDLALQLRKLHHDRPRRRNNDPLRTQLAAARLGWRQGQEGTGHRKGRLNGRLNRQPLPLLGQKQRLVHRPDAVF